MKLKVFFILLLTFLSGFALRGQSFVEQFATAEQIKEQYGETDDGYLDALAGAISAAFAEEKDEEANRLRLVHMGIVEKKYGVNSIEYAEDLWRLGNVSSYKGEDYVFDCYQRAAEIYEALGAEGEYPYCDILWNLSRHYYDNENWRMSIDYLKKCVSLYELWIDREWKGLEFSSMGLTNVYFVMGESYQFRMEDLISANAAYEECVKLIEKYDLLGEYEYATWPYLRLWLNNEALGNSEEAENWGWRYLDALEDAVWVYFESGNFEKANEYCQTHIDYIKKIYGETSLEYAEDLALLGLVSEYKGDEYTFDCFKRAEKIYEDNDAQFEIRYSDVLWELYHHYNNSEEWDTALSYLTKSIVLGESMMGKELENDSESNSSLGQRYFCLGNLYQFHIQDFKSAMEAYEKCVTIMEEYNLLKEYEFASMPYKGMALCNYNLGNYKDAEKWHLRYLAVIEQLEGNISDNYLTALFDLRTIYHDMEDIKFIENLSLKLLTLIEQRDAKVGISLQADTLYLKVQRELVLSYVKFKAWDELTEYVPDLLKTYEDIGLDETYDYWQAIYYLMLSYNLFGKYPESYSLFDKFEGLANVLGAKSTDDYWRYLNEKSETLAALSKGAEHTNTIREWEALTRQLYDESSGQSCHFAFKTADQHRVLGNIEEALRGIERCYQILDMENHHFNDDVDSLSFMADLHCMEGRIYTSSNPDYAEKKLIMAIAENETIERDDCLPFMQLGVLSFTKGELNKAIEYLKKARKLSENDYDSYGYIAIINLLGLCYIDLGQASLAITIFESINQTEKANYGREQQLYAVTEIGKGFFYLHINDYQSAIGCFKNVLAYCGEIYGNNSEEYAKWLDELGACFGYAGDFTTAENILQQAREIFEHLNSPQIFFVYHHLSATYLNSGEFDKGIEFLNKAESQLIYNGWEETDAGAEFYGFVGNELLKRSSPDGKNCFATALNILKEREEDGGQAYYDILLKYCGTLFLDNSQSEAFVQVITDAYKNRYLNDVSFMNTSEREIMMSGGTFVAAKDIIFSLRETDTFDVDLYDFIIFNKGLLLGTSIGYAKAVYDSGEEELVGKYETLQNLRRYINGEPVTLDGDYTAEKAKTEATAIEREITLYLRQNGGYTGGLDCSYEDVRDALGDDEIAVEFVEYKDYADNTKYYVALLAKRGWSEPKYVRLCKRDDLDKMVGQSPDKLYGETFVSQTAYDLIWTPLEPYLDSVRTVYFSPAGHINRMAVGHLYNGEKYFGETYNVVRVTSTREICNKYLPKDYSSAVLYGGLTYDEDDETLIAESRSVTGDVSGFRERFRGFTDGATRKGWNYLPGTLEEVNRISSVLADATINYDLYSSEKGNEESFKALSGTEFNILHIATHGFYMTESEAERSDFFSSYAMPRPSFGSFGTSSIDVQTLTMSFTPSPFSAGISPLQRSGLILSGGNRVWTGQTIPDGVEDGILTAAEVANLDFAWCDVVVLSACETGLGEITDEGVFGLQRAFKNAGVNTIVMSLWEVDDAATSLMMQTFYKNLVSGKSKRESFLTAQEKVREQYPDPRYWAAFIMLD